MKSLLTQEWLDDEMGHSGRNARYSLHMNEDERDAFIDEQGDQVEHEGRQWRPIGRWVVIGVDDETYQQVRESAHGMWFDGTAYWGGQEYDMGARSR